MPQYLTPAQVRAIGTGLSLASLSDADLGGLLDAAEADINSYMGFPEDDGLGFAPGVRTERSPWHGRSLRIYPRCMPVPVRSVSSLQIVVSQQAGDGTPVSATVPSNLVVINNDSGYLEIIAVAVTIYGLLPVLLDLSLVQPFALCVYLAGYQISKTNMALLDAGEHLVYHSFRTNWDLTTPPVIKKNGVVLDPSLYTINPQSGMVILTTSGKPYDSLTATFIHQIPDGVTLAARSAFLDHAAEHFPNTLGMSGLLKAKSDQQEATRASAKKDSPDPSWMRLLAPYKTMQIASTNDFSR